MARKIMAPVQKSSKPKPSPSPSPGPAPKAPARNAGAKISKGTSSAPQRRASAPIARGGGGGYQGGLPGGTSGMYSLMDVGGGFPGDLGGGPAPVVTPPSEEDYLAGDSAYQAQLSALKGALERYIADTDLQRSNYQTDYASSLRDLGYTEGLNGAPGQWNWEDQLTASGRAYQNQLNDFAARGMLQSQGYADAASDLERMLNQQYNQMATNKTNFMTDLDRQLANYKAENTSSQAAARAEAIARRAAQYGL